MLFRTASVSVPAPDLDRRDVSTQGGFWLDSPRRLLVKTVPHHFHPSPGHHIESNEACPASWAWAVFMMSEGLTECEWIWGVFGVRGLSRPGSDIAPTSIHQSTQRTERHGNSVTVLASSVFTCFFLTDCGGIMSDTSKLKLHPIRWRFLVVRFSMQFTSPDT